MEAAEHRPPGIRRARGIEGVHAPPEPHWVGDGFRVSGYFSTIANAARRLDPFLLLDYHPPYDYSATDRRRGVGVHPHRGFETVTLAWKGSVAHHDSAGGGGIIGPDEAQWMTAAAGILHKEYHAERYARAGGPFHMAQLWVNLPGKHKMAQPRYQSLSADRMGVVTLPDGAGAVRVVAGEYLGVRGPAETFTPVRVLDVRLNAGGGFGLVAPAPWNSAILVMSGEIAIHGATTARANDFIVFDNLGEEIAIEAAANTHLLALDGEPIGEPIVQYGPFVMTTEQEMRQAFADFHSGRFGHLED